MGISRRPQTHRVRDRTSRRGPCSIALRPTRTSSGVLWRSSARAGVYTVVATPEEAEFVFIVESGDVLDAVLFGDSGAPGPGNARPRHRAIFDEADDWDWRRGRGTGGTVAPAPMPLPPNPIVIGVVGGRLARQLAAVDPRRGRSGGGLPAASRETGPRSRPRASGATSTCSIANATAIGALWSRRLRRRSSGGSTGPAVPAHLCGDHRCHRAMAMRVDVPAAVGRPMNGAGRLTPRNWLGTPALRIEGHQPPVERPAGQRESPHPRDGAVRRLHGPGACHIAPASPGKSPAGSPVRYRIGRHGASRRSS